MPAIVTQVNNEDGILETHVEYFTERSITILEKLATHIAPTPLPTCDICAGDAHWHATPFGWGHQIDLCNEHMQSSIDKYQTFDRITP